ncbi:MAG TPA: hypothetical protein DCP67_06675 [Planctomycetaceae bacterium]|jgi:hypothetical protein|nr:hypothetical protein [Pirellulales bacterium]HAL13481.1 hypothetical protein [Planctomycetaceae bacterium]|tara:strand:+ start:267 stop:1130 length:864 start_codon:yes stop_codon:yes gene_type:complete
MKPAFNNRIAILAYALSICVVTSAVAQEWVMSRDHHSWGRFSKGSWKQVRVLTDVLNENGEVTSTSKVETTSQIIDRLGDTFALEIDVKTIVGERAFESPTQKVKREYQGKGKITISAPIDRATLEISGTMIQVEIREVTLVTKNERRVSQIHYSPDLAPFIFKRSTKAYDAENKLRYETNMSVEEFGIAHKVVGETHRVAMIKTVHEQNGTNRITEELFSEKVPGGVISHTSTDIDQKTKRVTKRSKLEIIDFAVGNNGGKRKENKEGKPGKPKVKPESDNESGSE